MLQSDWLLERAEFSHPDRHNGRRSISVEFTSLIVPVFERIYVEYTSRNSSLFATHEEICSLIHLSLPFFAR